MGLANRTLCIDVRLSSLFKRLSRIRDHLSQAKKSEHRACLESQAVQYRPGYSLYQGFLTIHIDKIQQRQCALFTCSLSRFTSWLTFSLRSQQLVSLTVIHPLGNRVYSLTGKANFLALE
jgi:hypothetical protein